MMARGSIAQLIGQGDLAMPYVRIVVAGIDGSTPREPGAAMIVDKDRSSGTIGGGQLEFEAIAHARALLEKDRSAMWLRNLRTWPLGPALGQCCGGTVRLLFERYGRDEVAHITNSQMPGDATGIAVHPTQSGKPVLIFSDRHTPLTLPLPVATIARDFLSGARCPEPLLVQLKSEDTSCFIEPLAMTATPLFIYGAGHVGEALVKVISDLDFEIHWVDTHADRFPETDDRCAQRVVAREPAIIAAAAPDAAFHVVLTYSHAIDLAICHALLSRPTFGFLGLIGSQTKRARFLKRLRDGGVTEAGLSRLTCPIGLGALRGKEPATIAVSVAAQLIAEREQAISTNQQDTRGMHGSVRPMRA